MFFRKFFARKLFRKVPQITIYFWIIKLLTTAMGESTSDSLVHNIDPIIAVILGGIFFIASLTLQLWVRRYIAFVYWLAVTMVAIFGTMAADVLHIVLDVPYFASTIFFTAALIFTFTLWQKIEKTISIHSIYTPRREIFYWLTIVITFALGTALGDMTATTLKLGYFISGIVFGIFFFIPLLGYKVFKVNKVFAFWFSYILTRPFGASFADWFGRSKDLGGIGFGTELTSLILTVFIILFVFYLTISKKDA